MPEWLAKHRVIDRFDKYFTKHSDKYGRRHITKRTFAKPQPASSIERIKQADGRRNINSYCRNSNEVCLKHRLLPRSFDVGTERIKTIGDIFVATINTVYVAQSRIARRCQHSEKYNYARA